MTKNLWSTGGSNVGGTVWNILKINLMVYGGKGFIEQCY